MSDPTRWTSALAVTWSPLLTFERRRSELLEWIETNAKPKAFLDEGELLGIAIGSMAQRVRIDRNSLLMQLGSRTATPDPLEDVAQGVFDTFEPQDVTVRDYRGLWTAGIEGEYSELTERLAKRAAPLASMPDQSGLTAVDAAILVDLVSSRGSYQVEFGIVTPDELAIRLNRGVVQRIDVGHLSPLLSVDSLPRDVPPVNLFMEFYFVDDEQEGLPTGSSVVAQMRAIETQITQFVRELAGAL